jgi:rRNA maturation protein Nop10
MRETFRAIYRGLRSVGATLAEPLRKDPEATGFRLSSPETHTTTIDGGIGWAQRPPARVECPRCGEHILQRDPRDDIDCQFCIEERDYTEFGSLDLAFMICPVCGDRMEHGNRHPDQFDVPEWATCHSCRYHWEYAHSY